MEFGFIQGLAIGIIIGGVAGLILGINELKKFEKSVVKKVYELKGEIKNEFRK
jgi:hypothetical protein